MKANGPRKSDDGKPRSNATLLIAGGVAAVLFLCCCGVGGGAWFLRTSIGLDNLLAKKPAPETEKEKKEQKPAGPASDFQLTVVDFTDEFMKDHTRAQLKYKTAVVELTGNVHHERTPQTVNLRGGKHKDGSNIYIRCHLLAESQATACRLSPGQKIKVIGKFNPGAFELRECLVFELEPTKLTLVNAENLAMEFDKDPKAAIAKYRDQELFVTATLQSVAPQPQPERPVATFKGTEKTLVTGSFLELKELAGREGKQVEFRGYLDHAISLRSRRVILSIHVIVPAK